MNYINLLVEKLSFHLSDVTPENKLQACDLHLSSVSIILTSGRFSPFILVTFKTFNCKKAPAKLLANFTSASSPEKTKKVRREASYVASAASQTLFMDRWTMKTADNLVCTLRD